MKGNNGLYYTWMTLLGMAIIAGEITTKANVSYSPVVRKAIQIRGDVQLDPAGFINKVKSG